jgi:hypothetical protein
MSQSVPRQPSASEVARGDVPSVPPADRPHPPAPRPAPNSLIEREIERSERASAALAASRVLARAAFTDSELAAEAATGAEDEGDGWVRTEYASLDHAVRAPQEDVPHDGMPRHLVGGSFDPGIQSPNGRAFHAAPIGHSPIRTRTGAEARFMQESRQTPRTDRLSVGGVKPEQTLTLGAARDDRPADVRAPAAPSAVRHAPAAAAAVRARSPAAPGRPFGFALAAGMGAVVALIGGGVAWKAGWLVRPDSAELAVVATRVVAQTAAARAVAEAPQEMTLAPPAAGIPARRSSAEVDAALAAAARAAAVPVASVHAAGPSRALVPASAVAPSTPVALRTAAAAAPVRSKDNVASAVANAQARSDRFLAPAGAATPSPAAETGAGR